MPTIRHLLECTRQARGMVIYVKAEYGSLSASEILMGYWTEAQDTPPRGLPEARRGPAGKSLVELLLAGEINMLVAAFMPAGFFSPDWLKQIQASSLPMLSLEETEL